MSYDDAHRDGIVPISWDELAVMSRSLVAHRWAEPAPDLCALVTDTLVLFPWDRQVFAEGSWQAHPELAGAIALQRGDRNGQA